MIFSAQAPAASSSHDVLIEKDLMRRFTPISVGKKEETDLVFKQLIFPREFDAQTQRLMYNVAVLAQEKFCFQAISYVLLSQRSIQVIAQGPEGLMTARRYCLPTTVSINSWCYMLNLDRSKEWADDFDSFKAIAQKLIPPDSISLGASQIVSLKNRLLRAVEKQRARIDDLELFWRFLIFEGFYSVQLQFDSIIRNVAEYFDEHFSMLSQPARSFLTHFNEHAVREQELFFAAKHDYEKSFLQGKMDAWEIIKQFSDIAFAREEERYHAKIEELLMGFHQLHESFCQRYREMYAKLRANFGSQLLLNQAVLTMLIQNPKLLHICCKLQPIFQSLFTTGTIVERDKAKIAALIPNPDEYMLPLTEGRYHFPLEKIYDEYMEKKRRAVEEPDLSPKQLMLLAEQLGDRRHSGRHRGRSKGQAVVATFPKASPTVVGTQKVAFLKSPIVKAPVVRVSEEELKEFIPVKVRKEEKSPVSFPRWPFPEGKWLLHDRVARWFESSRDVRKEDSAYAQVSDKVLKTVRANHAFGMKLYGFLIQYGTCYEGEDRQSFFLQGTLKKKEEEEKVCVFTLSRDRNTHVIFHAYATRHTVEELLEQYVAFGQKKVENPSREAAVYAPKTGMVQGFEDGSVVKEFIPGKKVVVLQQDGTENTVFLSE